MRQSSLARSQGPSVCSCKPLVRAATLGSMKTDTKPLETWEEIVESGDWMRLWERNIWDWGMPAELRIQYQKLRRLMVQRWVGINAERRAKCRAGCAEDPVGWVNDWVWTTDPRNLDVGLEADIPLDMWPEQEKFAEWLLDHMRIDPKTFRGGGVIEKTRDAGATWLICALFLHRWLFAPSGFIGGLGSRKGDLVYKRGDPDSLFEKIRFMVSYLPNWMLPRGFNINKHFKGFLLENPENGNVIRGEAGESIGRGGRATMYLVDEAAKVREDKETDASLSQTCRVQFWLSTPSKRGMQCEFAKKRHSGRFPVYILDWKDDPRKSAAWYTAEEANYGYNPTLIARELGRSYVTAGEQVAVPPIWIQDTMLVDLPRTKLRIAGLDVADGGGDLNVLVIRAGPVVLHIEAWAGIDTTETARRALRVCKEWHVSMLAFDAIGVGAGVRATMRREAKKYEIVALPVKVNKATSATEYDGQPANELYKNLKAELWFRLRRRAERTSRWYRSTVGEVDISEDAPVRWMAMLQLPKGCHELSSELGLVRYYTGEDTLIRIESKKALASRGIKSPDYAEALTLSEACYVVESEAEWLKRMAA